MNLEAWYPFYALVGGAAATLAGLLFVALSLNRDRFFAHDGKTMLRLAQRCFADYLYVLFISMAFLIPDIPRSVFAGLLVFWGVRRVYRLFRHARDAAEAIARKLTDPHTLREYAFPAFSGLALTLAGVMVGLKHDAWLYLVPFVAIGLCASASWSAWLLLVWEKDYANRV